MTALVSLKHTSMHYAPNFVFLIWLMKRVVMALCFLSLRPPMRVPGPKSHTYEKDIAE